MFLKYNFLAMLWAIFILALMAIPGRDLPDLSLWDRMGIDKVAHAILFAIFVLLLIVGFTKQYSFRFIRYHPKITSLIVGIVYGGFTEILQQFLASERKADLFDFLANAFGCIIGLFAFNLIYRKTT